MSDNTIRDKVAEALYNSDAWSAFIEHTEPGEFDTSTRVDGVVTFLGLADAAIAAYQQACIIETADHLAELVDTHGHEIVVLDAEGGACQGFYDFDADQFPATLLWTGACDE